jgi:hypothetical protein
VCCKQETVYITRYDKFAQLQSLGKCHNENMSKAACLTIILAYVTEEETIYRKRKRNTGTKDWLKSRSVFGHSNLIKGLELSSPLVYKNCFQMCPLTFSELLELVTHLLQREDTSMREAISLKWVTWYNSSQTCPYTLQNVPQPDCCITKFKPEFDIQGVPGGMCQTLGECILS